MLRKWFVRWHGEGSEEQFDIFRCRSCRALMTWNRIRSHGACKCGASSMSPTKPSFVETLKLLVLPWTV